jgi:hypothetical protein
VQYSRTGLLDCSRFRAKECNPSVASPCRAWSKAFPARLVWTLLPLQAANNRQPLPHVAGSPDFRVLRADPTPRAPSVGLSVWVDVTYLFPGALGASQVPDASLRTCHVLRTPPELHRLARTAASCWLPRPLPRRPPDVSPCGEDYSFRGCTKLRGARSPLRPVRCSVYASASSFGWTLLRSCNTRYGWLARPYPVGTLTPQEAPSSPGAQRTLSSAASTRR